LTARARARAPFADGGRRDSTERGSGRGPARRQTPTQMQGVPERRPPPRRCARFAPRTARSVRCRRARRLRAAYPNALPYSQRSRRSVPTALVMWPWAMFIGAGLATLEYRVRNRPLPVAQERGKPSARADSGGAVADAPHRKRLPEPPPVAEGTQSVEIESETDRAIGNELPGDQAANQGLALMEQGQPGAACSPMRPRGSERSHQRGDLKTGSATCIRGRERRKRGDVTGAP